MVFEDDTSWLDTRIARTEELIVIYEDALEAIGSGEQEYLLDTGQTRQRVTRANLQWLKATLEGLENRRERLKARRNGAGFNIRPVH